MLESASYLHLTAIACVTAASVYFLTKSRRTYPTVTSGIPILGALAKWSQDAPALLIEARKKYGDVFSVNLVFLRFTFLLGGESHRMFFRSKDEVLDFQKAVSRLSQATLGPEPFKNKEFSDEMWKLITKGFSSQSRLRMYMEWILEDAAKELRRYAEEGRIDLFQNISSLTAKVVLRCTLGTEMCEKYGDEIARLIYEVETLAASPWLLVLPTFPTPIQIRMNHSRTRLLKIFEDTIEERIANPEKWKYNKEYLQLIINEAPESVLRQKDQLPLHLLSISLAAFTNTAGTMGWTIAHLAKNQDLQEKVRDEMEKCNLDIEKNTEDEVLGKIAGLKFLEACMRETVRMYALLVLVRETVQDIEYQGHLIPKGEIIAISPMVLHRDPEIFPQPNTYNPERFMDKEATDTVIRNMEFVQFGYLKHRCLGERFANFVLKTVWYTLFTRYNVSVVGDISEADFTKAGGTPFPKSPIILDISKRNN